MLRNPLINSIIGRNDILGSLEIYELIRYLSTTLIKCLNNEEDFDIWNCESKLDQKYI